jgi:predicted nucleic acid-binding protein
MIHLDTSFLIHLLRAGSRQERLLLTWLARSEEIGLSAFAWAEFLCGPVSTDAAAHALALLGEPAPVDRRTAERAAALFNAAGRRRGSFGDCLIAAAAIEAGATLATENTADFARFSSAGLVLAM